MEAQPQRPRVACMEPVAHDPCPQASCRAELRDFFEEVVMAVEEERQPRRKVINREARLNAYLNVSYAVGQCERQLLHGCRPRFPNVVSADTDHIPAGELASAAHEHVL